MSVMCYWKALQNRDTKVTPQHGLNILDVVHSDVFDPMDVVSKGGAK